MSSLHWPTSSCGYFLATTRTLNCTDGTHCTDWIQLGQSNDITSECSERTRWKHHLRHLFYCCVSYHVITTQQRVINTCRTVVWRQIRMRCIVLCHMYMHGHKGNSSTLQLRSACTRTHPVVCHPAMPWANSSHCSLLMAVHPELRDGVSPFLPFRGLQLMVSSCGSVSLEVTVLQPLPLLPPYGCSAQVAHC
jgi:hypothetical protein